MTSCYFLHPDTSAFKITDGHHCERTDFSEHFQSLPRYLHITHSNVNIQVNEVQLFQETFPILASNSHITCQQPFFFFRINNTMYKPGYYCPTSLVDECIFCITFSFKAKLKVYRKYTHSHVMSDSNIQVWCKKINNFTEILLEIIFANKNFQLRIF